MRKLWIARATVAQLLLPPGQQRSPADSCRLGQAHSAKAHSNQSVVGVVAAAAVGAMSLRTVVTTQLLSCCTAAGPVSPDRRNLPCRTGSLLPSAHPPNQLQPHDSRRAARAERAVPDAGRAPAGQRQRRGSSGGSSDGATISRAGSSSGAGGTSCCSSVWGVAVVGWVCRSGCSVPLDLGFWARHMNICSGLSNSRRRGRVL